MAEIAALGLRVDGADGIEKTASALDHLTKSANSAETATDSLSKLSRELAESQSALASAMRGLDSSVSALSSDLRASSAASAEAAKKADELARARREEEQATQKARQEAADYASSLKNILDRSDPLAAATRKHSEDMKVLDRALKEGKISTDQYAKATDMLEKELKETKDEIEGVGKSADGTSQLLTRMAGVLAAAFSVNKLKEYADSWSEMTSLVRVNIGEQENAAEVMSRLSDVARMTYSSMEATARSFASNAFTLNALGKTTQQQLDYTEALNNALVVSGAKGQQFEMVQNSLNRAMAEGSLRGTDLQNVLNYGSRVAGLLADELGVNVTELRAVAAQGKITGEVIYNALTKNMEQVRQEAESMPATIEDAFTLLRNAALQTVGIFDQQNNISETLATTLIAVADNMREVAVILASAAAGWVTYQVAVNGVAVALRVAAAAQALFNAAAMANPYVAAASAVVALSVALYGLRNNTIGAGEDAATLGDYFAATWDRVKQGTSGLVDYVSAAWKEFKRETGGLVDAVSSSFSWLWKELKISAHVTINDTIGIIKSLDDTIRIVVKAMYEQFRNGFQNIAALAKAFGQGVAAVFRGDFGFDAFRKALADKVGTPAKNTAKEIRDAWKKNLGKDWLGDAAASVVRFGREISEAAKSSRKLQNDLDKLIDSSGLFFGEMKAGGPVISGTNDELEGLSKTLQSLVDKYDKLGAAQRAAAADLAGLLKAVELGLPGAEAALEAFYEGLMVADDALKRATESVRENAAEADPLAESWQEALNRIDSAFVELWKSAFNGFKDFADSLKNAFIQLLAELAHRATTQKILIGLGFTAGSGGAMAGTAGGGAGMLGGLLNAGSWISAGKTLWQGFSGLMTGQGLSGFSGILGRFGADAAFESAAPKGGLEAAWAQADAAASMAKFANTVGPILAGLGGAIQGWQSGNRMNAVTGAVGGWGGAKAGAAAGSYFLPGIGTAIGAVLGGILGSSLGSSVFGGSWENRRSGIELGFDDEGLLLQDWIRQTKKGGLFGSTKRRYIYSEMEEALAEEFRTGYDTMIDVLGTQFMAIGADLDRAVFEGVRIGAANINTSDQTEEEVQAQIEKWFSDLQQAMIKGALNAAGDSSAAVRLLRATGGDVAMLEALGGLMGVAGINAVQQARDAQTQQLSMVESYRAVTDATRTLISEYDGSLEATLGLTEAMAIQQELAYGLATAYLQASDAVGALFGNLKESIRTSLMGAEELYEYQRSQVHNLTDLLGTLTDPEAILRTSQEIERLVSGMWSRLDEGQRSLLGEEFLDYLDRTEALAQDRLA
ncbi:MAG: tape measure protein, partial [Pseudomonas sp.]|nr:tape measure protein [Pseudomonas sp.]